MKRTVKTWLLIAAALMLFGALLFGIVMSLLGWNFTKLETVTMETNIHEVQETFENVAVDTAAAEVRFAPAEDGRCRVECREQQKLSHTVTVKNGTLRITAKDTRQWYDHLFNISFTSPQITVYLPQKTYAAFTVKTVVGGIALPSGLQLQSAILDTSTGWVYVSAAVKETLHITTTTGETCVENVTCGSLTTVGRTGGVMLKNVIVKDAMQIERNTGSVTLTDCDADTLFIKINTGSVSGHLLSEKVFITHTNTGRVSVPQTTAGGRCEIITNTGDITIE